MTIHFTKYPGATEPVLSSAVRETPGGELFEGPFNKATTPLHESTGAGKSGDATVPYVSLSWAQVSLHGTAEGVG